MSTTRKSTDLIPDVFAELHCLHLSSAPTVAAWQPKNRSEFLKLIAIETPIVQLGSLETVWKPESQSALGKRLHRLRFPFPCSGRTGGFLVERGDRSEAVDSIALFDLDAFVSTLQADECTLRLGNELDLSRMSNSRIRNRLWVATKTCIPDRQRCRITRATTRMSFGLRFVSGSS